MAIRARQLAIKWPSDGPQRHLVRRHEDDEGAPARLGPESVQHDSRHLRPRVCKRRPVGCWEEGTALGERVCSVGGTCVQRR